MLNSRRKNQNIGYLAGATLGIITIGFLTTSWGEFYLKPGPSNIGHENIKCQYCHKLATGTFRQQIQANIQYLLGKRPKPADFGRKDVSNESCIGCHQRSDDRHPVYRFFEPRFKKARKQIKPQFCISCHLEHTGKRVTLADTEYCQICHKKLVLKKDPVSIPHRQLIQDKKWQTCLGCHDFHGNHMMKTRREVSEAISTQRIINYFQGAKSPYSNKKYKKAFKKPVS